MANAREERADLLWLQELARIDAEEFAERMDTEPEDSCYDPDEYRDPDYYQRFGL